MSWIEQLWRTYEANSSEVGRQSEEDRAQLLPICHSTQQAHIEITIDGDGQFIRARVVPQEDLRTIIPTTERSATRGGIKPVNHPLCDSLQYVAGDFLEFGAKVTSGYAKRPEEPFELYLNDLRAWCESPYTHPKVEAVLHYVQRRSVIRDLVSSQVLHVDEACKLMELWDREKGDPPEIFALLKNRPQWE